MLRDSSSGLSLKSPTSTRKTTDRPRYRPFLFRCRSSLLNRRINSVARSPASCPHLRFQQRWASTPNPGSPDPASTDTPDTAPPEHRKPVPHHIEDIDVVRPSIDPFRTVCLPFSKLRKPIETLQRFGLFCLALVVFVPFGSVEDFEGTAGV